MPAKDEGLTLLDRVYRTGQSESHTEQPRSKPDSMFWSYTMWPVLADKRPVGVMIQVTETTQLHDKTVAMNEALVLGSLRQHELTEAADALNVQLQSEVAERRQAESALRESEQHFRALFELGPMAVYSCDAAGVIQNFNRRAAELWGRACARTQPIAADHRGLRRRAIGRGRPSGVGILLRPGQGCWPPCGVEPQGSADLRAPAARDSVRCSTISAIERHFRPLVAPNDLTLIPEFDEPEQQSC
jgi:PAS domain-containing protein